MTIKNKADPSNLAEGQHVQTLDPAKGLETGNRLRHQGRLRTILDARWIFVHTSQSSRRPGTHAGALGQLVVGTIGPVGQSPLPGCSRLHQPVSRMSWLRPTRAIRMPLITFATTGRRREWTLPSNEGRRAATGSRDFGGGRQVARTDATPRDLVGDNSDKMMPLAGSPWDRPTRLDPSGPSGVMFDAELVSHATH